MNLLGRDPPSKMISVRSEGIGRNPGGCHLGHSPINSHECSMVVIVQLTL